MSSESLKYAKYASSFRESWFIQDSENDAEKISNVECLNIVQCMPVIKVHVSGELLKNWIKILDEISKLKYLQQPVTCSCSTK